MADAQRESERKGVASFKAGPETAGLSEEMDQLLVTINAAAGKIVRVEKLDKAGKHHELSEDDCAKLVGEDEVEEIEAALEEAFEAGVAGVLGSDDEVEGEYEDNGDRAIRRFLISEFLIPRSVRRRIMTRLLLSRMLHHRFIKRRSNQ
jgi:hypothetical protein